MTTEEFAAVLIYLQAGVGKEMPKEQQRVYFDLLGDLPAEALKIAAQQALASSDYPIVPTVGTLRRLALAAMRPPGLSAAESWGLVLAAVQRFGFARQAQALASLPPEVAGAVERFGWESLCDSTSPETCRAQWCRLWDSHREYQEKRELLPEAVRKVAGQLAAKYAPPALEDRREGNRPGEG